MSDTPTTRVVISRSALALWDVVSWFAAMMAFVGARYDFNLHNVQWKDAIIYAVVAAVLQLVIGYVTKLYRGRSRVASFDEFALLTLVVAGIGLALGLYYFIDPPVEVVRGRVYLFPKGVTFTAPFGALLLMFTGRFVSRAFLTRNPQRVVAAPAEPVLIYGAGNAGQQLGRLIANDPDNQYELAGFIDDDPAKRNLHLFGTKVRGTGDDLVKVADDEHIQTVILAIGNADKKWLQKLDRVAESNNLKLLTLPPVGQMVGGVTMAQLHQVDVADLLGRSVVKTDLSAISGYLSGKVVLVTGAGGSIGSEIARQVYKFGPKELVMLDRDESLLHATQLSIFNQGLLDTPNMVLCDIRDIDALDKVFADHHPDVVFHVAALKHLPMLEQYPLEGWKTNVLGSLNVLRCATKYDVHRYVNVSTDKAADPTSVLGKTKRLAEELTAWYARQGAGTYLSVRFGNVLGSRGSMLHTFTSQIEKGGPVTVTHPDINRYFMTIPEACELVIQAGAIGQPGDVLVLDMGEPILILDVAKRLIRKSGKDIDVVFTGLRPNEKMAEVLFSTNEASTPTTHPKISRVAVPPRDPALVEALDGSLVTSMDVNLSDRALLGAGVPEATPDEPSASNQSEEFHG